MQREACKLDYENALLENVSFLCIPCNFSTVTQIYTVIKNIFKKFLKLQSSPKYLKDRYQKLVTKDFEYTLFISNSFSGFYSNFQMHLALRTVFEIKTFLIFFFNYIIHSTYSNFWPNYQSKGIPGSTLYFNNCLQCSFNLFSYWLVFQHCTNIHIVFCFDCALIHHFFNFLKEALKKENAILDLQLEAAGLQLALVQAQVSKSSQ